MSVIARNNVTIHGAGERVLMFAHGFGCDQSMWRHVARSFMGDNRVVLFDHVGAGASDLDAYSSEKYGRLHGYADDVVEICEALGVSDVTFIGHSVSATIGVLAAVKRSDLFSGLALVCPSPRYADTDTYTGGFKDRDLDELLDLIDMNHLDWAAALAPTVMGAGAAPELTAEWRDSVCRTDPVVAKEFARVTFRSDHRAEYREVSTPTLIIECSDDNLAPPEVGAWVHEAIQGSRRVILEAPGHCPHVTSPAEVIAALRDFLPAAALANAA